MQSLEISLAEQQLTDQVKFTSVMPFEILQAVSGQYLDYEYDMRVERVQRQGILYTCDCCVNVDEILYTPLNYDKSAIEYSEMWYLTQEVIPRQLYPLASEHVTEIAEAMGLNPVMQFEDFYSTVEMNSQKDSGATYADLIRDIFGWSARIPTQLINVYIRGKNLFVIQRGQEANVIDISEAAKTMPLFEHKLMRTYYQRDKYSKTAVRETKRRKINPTATSREVHDSEDSNSAYDYDDNGLLKKTVSTTTDRDGNEIRTETEYKYKELESGIKVLTKEVTEKYVNGELEEKTEIKHTPLKQGLSHQVKTDEEGDIIGEGVGQNTSDDRRTPYSQYREDNDDEYETMKEYNDVEGFTLFDTSFPIQSVVRENFTEAPFPIIGLTEEQIESVDTDKGQGRLKAITEAIKSLNRKTQETVTLSLYDFPHLIDFNDRVVLDGAEYYVVGNIARTTPRIRNEQNLTMVRWLGSDDG